MAGAEKLSHCCHGVSPVELCHYLRFVSLGSAQLCCTGYYAATLLLEVGWLQRAYHYASVWLKKSVMRLKQLRHSQQGYQQTESDPAEAAEDEDVREERLAVQAGAASVTRLNA